MKIRNNTLKCVEATQYWHRHASQMNGLEFRFPKPCPRAVRLPKSSSARTRIHTRAAMRARRPLISYALFNQSPEGLWNFLLSIISVWIILLNCCFSKQLQGNKESTISVNMTQTEQTQRNYEFLLENDFSSLTCAYCGPSIRACLKLMMIFLS